MTDSHSDKFDMRLVCLEPIHQFITQDEVILATVVQSERGESFVVPPLDLSIEYTSPCTETVDTGPPEDAGAGYRGGCEAKHLGLSTKQPVRIGPFE